VSSIPAHRMRLIIAIKITERGPLVVLLAR
jgi:hypothetical protein